jgi:hypothetical protein
MSRGPSTTTPSAMPCCRCSVPSRPLLARFRVKPQSRPVPRNAAQPRPSRCLRVP